MAAPRRTTWRPGPRGGVTFAEILIAVLILGTAGVSLIAMFMSAYGHIDKAETHRRALTLAEELVCFARAKITIQDGETFFCGQKLTLPVQFRTPMTDPDYLECGLPQPPPGFAYSLEIEHPDQDGSTSDREELLTAPADSTLAASAAKLLRKVTASVLFEGGRTVSLQTLVVNTHAH